MARGAGTGGGIGAISRGCWLAKSLDCGSLVVAIPALIFYRYFQRRVDELAVSMEQEAIKLVEVMMGERDQLEAREAKEAKEAVVKEVKR